jgi:hypothetical protein
MKFSQIIKIALILTILLSYCESRRIRSKHRRGLGGDLLELFSGFVSGLSGADGKDINSCLPAAWKSSTLQADTSNKLPAQFDPSVLGAFKYVYYSVKWAFEVACIFKDQLLKYFKVVRRRQFFVRFLNGKSKGVWDVIKNYVSSKWDELKNWVSGVWADTKEWTKAQLEKVKDWTKEKWNEFKDGVNSAVAQIKSVYHKIKDFITSPAFLTGIETLFKCTIMTVTLILNLVNVVKAIIAIASGNVVQWAVMIVNFVCLLPQVYKAIQIAIAIPQKPWYFSGKLLGHLLNIFGGTVKGKEVEKEVTKAPSTIQRILKWIKDNNIIEGSKAAKATYDNATLAAKRRRHRRRLH